MNFLTLIKKVLVKVKGIDEERTLKVVVLFIDQHWLMLVNVFLYTNQLDFLSTLLALFLKKLFILYKMIEKNSILSST